MYFHTSWTHSRLVLVFFRLLTFPFVSLSYTLNSSERINEKAYALLMSDSHSTEEKIVYAFSVLFIFKDIQLS